MADYAKLSLLRYRWVGQSINLRELIGNIKSDPNWHKAESYKTIMSALRPIVIETKEVDRDLRGAPLSGADLLKAHLSGADLLKANLSGTYLREANLSGANLWGADLSKANLRGANLSRANLWGSNLSEADLTEADLAGTNLCEANLSGADLWKANLSGALLREGNLSGANLWETNLSGAELGDVLFTTDEVFNRLLNWWGPKILSHIPFLNRMKPFQNLKKVGMTILRGIDTGKINGSKNPILKRYIEDYQFIQGFKKKSWFHRWIFYPLWKVSSDCGRSLLLWLIWSVGLMGLFSWVYYRHQVDWFNQVNLSWLNVWYLSLTKFMSLGFGNAAPKIDHPTAQIWMIVEIVIGYVMFGGLISILINKLVRRA
jgi:uncharacterized protein YjbI with pentapeptide repeats